jgi:hypothetical protein
MAENGIEIVTASLGGSKHVDSEDFGALQAGIVGSGSYIMEGGSRCAASMTDANTVQILDGEWMMQGRHVRFKGTNTVTIESGEQGKFRHDLLVGHWTKNPDTSVEGFALQYIPGTSAATADGAKDPAYSGGTILDAASTDVAVPFARIILNGLMPSVSLIPPAIGSLKTFQDATAASLKTLQDSVSQSMATYTGVGDFNVPRNGMINSAAGQKYALYQTRFSSGDGIFSFSDNGIRCAKAGFVEVSACLTMGGLAAGDLMHLLIYQNNTSTCIAEAIKPAGGVWTSITIPTCRISVSPADVLYLFIRDESGWGDNQVFHLAPPCCWMSIKYLPVVAS